MLDPVQRFWAQVDTTPGQSKGCWNWKGKPKEDGYGQFLVKTDGKQKLYKAHRYSWELHNGPIPPGFMVCHTCDNRMCVKPEHFFLGTHKDNSQDMVQKGRSCLGQKNGRTGLTDQQAKEILLGFFKDGVPKKELLKRYPIGYTALGFLLRGQSWVHVRKELKLPPYVKKGGRWPSQQNDNP